MHMPYVPFKEVKEFADILTVANWLGLELKNNPTQCPHNEGDERELVINGSPMRR
jgi:hypothetical protein